MQEEGEYKVELDVFEGPLDLLLYLIKREEIDIYDIPIERITSQYMEYLNVMRMLDLNIAGEFIVMAATLMMIKSRMLLPVEERTEAEEEEEEDPRWELVRQLVEYKKFKDAAFRLQERELHQENIFGLGGTNVVFEPDGPETTLQDVSLFDLIAAFNDVLKRARPEEIGEIVEHRFTVADKMDHILRTIRTTRSVGFTTLFGHDATRNEIICTFLALLELIRLRHIAVVQEGNFGDIMVNAGASEDEHVSDEQPVGD